MNVTSNIQSNTVVYYNLYHRKLFNPYTHHTCTISHCESHSVLSFTSPVLLHLIIRGTNSLHPLSASTSLSFSYSPLPSVHRLAEAAGFHEHARHVLHFSHIPSVKRLIEGLRIVEHILHTHDIADIPVTQ